MFARILMVFVQAPIWGAQHFKDPVRIGMALGVTAIFLPYMPYPENFPVSAGGFMLAVLQNIGVGAVIGWVSFLVMAAAQFGGEMLDIQMGLSAAAQSDPASHGAVNLLRRLHFYMAMLLYLMVNGHHRLWISIYKSFQIVPLTYFQIQHAQPGGELTAQMAQFIKLSSDLYVIGLQIASPAVGALFVAQVALGMVARAAPQMNVFMISFPMNLSIGLILLTLCSGWVMDVMKYQFQRNEEQVDEAVIRMAP
ncbi:unnamed protein product, partial [Phaeothamnion confervicola]